jgi:hypothetical protein
MIQTIHNDERANTLSFEATTRFKKNGLELIAELVDVCTWDDLLAQVLLFKLANDVVQEIKCFGPA